MNEAIFRLILEDLDRAGREMSGYAYVLQCKRETSRHPRPSEDDFRLSRTEDDFHYQSWPFLLRAGRKSSPKVGAGY